jgi:formylglycine-generating enzyme required for sulfatase activity
MGAQNPPDMDHDQVGMQATEDSRPVHRVYLDGFWMEKTDITNAQFAKVIGATHYITETERTPKARRPFRGPHSKTLLQALLSSHHLINPFCPTTNSNGGAS